MTTRQINETDDACEAFETLLAALHRGTQFPKRPGKSRGRCDQVWCIAHDIFHVEYEIVKVCRCGATDSVLKSDPLQSYLLTLYPDEIFA